MASVTVTQIDQGRKDGAGVDVKTVYAKNPPLYAVYRTGERVAVQYADDDATAKAQRTALVKLNALRSEIAGLLDDWRVSARAKRQSTASRYERRVATALVLGLEGDTEGGLALLAVIKGDILHERISWARLQYLMIASATVIAAIVLIGLVGGDWFRREIYAVPAIADHLLLAAAAGTIGAFFSVSSGIRSRTILTDLHFWDNACDANLRIVIGLIAAAFLMCLVDAKVVSVTIADPTNMTALALSPLVLGFLAGFSERLIPDLLAKTEATLGANLRPAAPPAPAGNPAAGPIDKPPEPPAGPLMPDDCLCGHPVQPGEETPDTALPAAIGGVAKAE